MSAVLALVSRLPLRQRPFGVDEYLYKPIVPSELATVLRRLIGAPKAEVATQPKLKGVA